MLLLEWHLRYGERDMTLPEKIYFQSNGDKCCGLFYEPEQSNSGHCIVMAHGLAGIKEMRLDAYAEKFAQAGYSVLLFDYRFFGESGGEPRQLIDIKKQHQDWLAAINFATSIKKMDSGKIILWGSSLSGGHVIEVAHMLSNVAAVVAQVPHVYGLSSGLASGFLHATKLTMVGIRDWLRGVFGKSPLYLNASGEPGELALMTAPGESQGYINLMPEGFKFDHRVAARFILEFIFYNPGKKLKSLKMPVFIQVGLLDKTTPAKASIHACKGASSVELKTYEFGHFEPYVEPMFSSFVSDQIKFLNQVTQSKS